MLLPVVLLVVAGCGASAPERPSDADLAPERSAAEKAVSAFGPSAWDLGDPLAEASRDVCQDGQRNSKVHEVAFGCTVGRSWLLPAAGDRDDVEVALETMLDRLADLGCEPVGEGGLDVALRYWTEGTTGDAGALPTGRYTCDGTDVQLQPVSATNLRLDPVSVIGDLTGGDVGTPQEQPFAADVEQQVEATGDALLWQVTASRTYGAIE